MTEPSVENLRKASMAIYIAVDKHVADDVSNLLRWAANEIERLRRTAGESASHLPQVNEESHK